MLNNKFLLFFIISLLFSQEFDPETGDLVKKKFNPKTGELVKPADTTEVDKRMLKSSENTIQKENIDVENSIVNLQTNQVEKIKVSTYSDSDFDRIYFEETMYLQSGFWSPVYEKYGRKISKAKAYKELENYDDSRNLYEAARMRLAYSVLGAGLVVLSPILGASTENFMVFSAAYFGGLFAVTYNTVAYSNLIRKSVWIFNREAIKSNLKNDL